MVTTRISYISQKKQPKHSTVACISCEKHDLFGIDQWVSEQLWLPNRRFPKKWPFDLESPGMTVWWSRWWWWWWQLKYFLCSSLLGEDDPIWLIFFRWGWIRNHLPGFSFCLSFFILPRCTNSQFAHEFMVLVGVDEICFFWGGSDVRYSGSVNQFL